LCLHQVKDCSEEGLTKYRSKNLSKSLISAEGALLGTMNSKHVFVVIACVLLLSFLFYSFFNIEHENEFAEFYVGVDVAYADLDKIKNLVDQVAGYTNIVIIGSTGITYDQYNLNQTILYLEDQDLSYAVFAAGATRLVSINESVSSYNDNFVGVYYDDENGGRQLDLDERRSVYSADNYSDAASQFIANISSRLNAEHYLNTSHYFIVPSSFRLFTSDYALYWFDYVGGYDVVLAQLGWNYSRQLNVALCRGAATVMDKDWGVIVTWTYTDPPYLGSGEELFDDLVLAYENGAKYILVFDSDENYTQSTLEGEHLDALERFWQYTKDNPRPTDLLDGRVAFVLPKDYGYGFRGPNDKVWGLWENDELSSKVSEDLGILLEEYGSKLDVIYDDGLELDDAYKQYFFWNRTSYSP